MSRESELRVAAKTGARHFDKGQNHPPSSDRLMTAIDSAAGNTTSSERDKAYNDGRSAAGRNAKK